MRFSTLTKALVIAAISTIAILSFTGCAKKITLHDSDLSKQEIALENYLPTDTLMSFSINLSDEAQKQKFDKIVSRFPQEGINSLIEGIADEMAAEFSEDGIEFGEKLAPAFGNQFKMLFAITGPPIEKEDKDEDPNMIIAFTLADAEKLVEVIDKMVEENPNYIKSELFNAVTIDNEDDDAYGAIYKDTLVVANTKEGRRSALKRMKNNEDSLLSNEQFKQTYESLPKPNLGYAYMNMNKLFDFIAETEDEKIPDSPFFNALFTEAFAFVAHKDGLEMIINIAFDESVTEFNINDFPYNEPYLFRGIPGDNLMMYSESYGLKQAIDIQLEMLKSDEDTWKEFRKAELLIKKTVGIDLQEDILSWMDKGYAIVLQKNASLIPGLSLYIDASSNPEGAQKIVDLLDTAFIEMVDTMKFDAPSGVDPDKYINKGVAPLGKSELHKMSIDFSEMSDEDLLAAGLPSGIFVEPIEIYYGLTTNNYFIFSTYVGLDEKYNKEVSVENAPGIKEGREYLKNYPYGISYINVDGMLDYVDIFVDSMQKVEGPYGEKFEKDYALVKEYLAPIEYFVAGNKKGENVAEGLFFVRID